MISFVQLRNGTPANTFHFQTWLDFQKNIGHSTYVDDFLHAHNALSKKRLKNCRNLEQRLSSPIPREYHSSRVPFLESTIPQEYHASRVPYLSSIMHREDPASRVSCIESIMHREYHASRVPCLARIMSFTQENSHLLNFVDDFS